MSQYGDVHVDLVDVTVLWRAFRLSGCHSTMTCIQTSWMTQYDEVNVELVDVTVL